MSSMTEVLSKHRQEHAPMSGSATCICRNWVGPYTMLESDDPRFFAAHLAKELADAGYGKRDEELLRFVEGLDDNLCDALCAARQGRYDGMKAETHLENLIERLREVTYESQPMPQISSEHAQRILARPKPSQIKTPWKDEKDN